MRPRLLTWALMALSAALPAAEIEELEPSFDYRTWFDNATGDTANANFGAWTCREMDGVLYLGFSGGFPLQIDGALLASHDGDDLTTLVSLPEEGMHEMTVHDGVLNIPGSDPDDGGWEWGNYHTYSPAAGHTEYRNIPEAVHTFGDWIDDDGTIWISTGSYDGNPDGYSARIYKTTDLADGWTEMTNFGTYPTSYRGYDIVRFDGDLYATVLKDGDTDNGKVSLYRSQDEAASWTELSAFTENLENRQRLVLFDDHLLAFKKDRDEYIALDTSGTATTYSLPGSFNNDTYNNAAVAGDGYLYMVFRDTVTPANDGKIYRLAEVGGTWEHVITTGIKPCSLYYWETEKKLVFGETDLDSDVWLVSPDYALSVESGTGDGDYIYGDEVAVEADAAPAGQTFHRWIGDSEYLTNAYAASATITMPATHITVTADYATVHHVANSGDDSDGSTWAKAYHHLQDAIDAAGDGDEVWVKAETHKPDDGGGTGRSLAYSLKNGVRVYGGFKGDETSREERGDETSFTILSGDIGIIGDNSDNCYHVFYHDSGDALDDTARIDGFLITGGNANGIGADANGGGMRNDSSSPTIVNCVFNDNSATNGGGMYNNGCDPAIINCVFSDNSATNGGGIYGIDSDALIANSIFWDNSSDIYGAPEAAYCVIEDGYPAGTGIISSNPLLDADDFYPAPSSTAIDAGVGVFIDDDGVFFRQVRGAPENYKTLADSSDYTPTTATLRLSASDSRGRQRPTVTDLTDIGAVEYATRWRVTAGADGLGSYEIIPEGENDKVAYGMDDGSHWWTISYDSGQWLIQKDYTTQSSVTSTAAFPPKNGWSNSYATPARDFRGRSE